MFLLPLALGILSLLASQEAPAGCSAPPAASTVQEDAATLHFQVDGGGVDETCSTSFVTGTEWLVDLTVATVDGIHDMLSLDGSLVHAIPPHGEGANATPLPVAVSIDAGTLSGGTHVVPFTAVVDHGNHRDVLEGSVTLEVFFEEIFDFHFIFDYAVEIEATHTVAVPSLSTGWLLLLSAAVALFGSRRLRR